MLLSQALQGNSRTAVVATPRSQLAISAVSCRILRAALQSSPASVAWRADLFSGCPPANRLSRTPCIFAATSGWLRVWGEEVEKKTCAGGAALS